jgi:hypothetical protein
VDEFNHLRDSEAVREHHRFRAAWGAAVGEQFERATAVGLREALATTLMRTTRHLGGPLCPTWHRTSFLSTRLYGARHHGQDTNGTLPRC